MKPMNLMVIAALAVVVSGCAQRHFVKAGATSHDFETDLAACRFQIMTAGALMTPDLVVECLRGKGWREQ